MTLFLFLKPPYMKYIMEHSNVQQVAKQYIEGRRKNETEDVAVEERNLRNFETFNKHHISYS